MRHQSLALILFGAVFTLGFSFMALVFVPLSDSQGYAPTAVAQVYGELEAHGREVYQREGCAYCHSQQVRSLDYDRPYGTWAAQPGDYAYDSVHPLGRLRMGPDLRFVGDRQSSPEWYVDFLRRPASGAHGMMPSYDHLSEDELRALGAYLASRQGGYADDAEIAVAGEPTSPFAVPEAYAGRENPVTATAEVLRLGGERFNTYCASCHGMAGDGKGAAAMAMNPPPADFTRAMYQEAEDVYLYWRIAEGVPGTMMPPWESVFTEEEIWELVHYLREFHGS